MKRAANRLRSYDSVYFTKPSARKLAHYVKREITRCSRRVRRRSRRRPNLRRRTPMRSPANPRRADVANG
jgi:hypothetical protein